MQEQLTKKENIKFLWGQLNNDGTKTKFIKQCSEEFKRSTKTIRQYWFSETGEWSVPLQFQDQIISMLQTQILLQERG